MSYNYSTSAPYSQPVTNIPANQQLQQFQEVPQYQDVTPIEYQVPQKQPSSLGVAFGTGIVGAGAGALISLKNNPIVNKAGEVTTEFAAKAYEKYLERAKDGTKDLYQQSLDLINKLEGVKKPDELKALLKAYPEATEFLLKDTKKTPEKYLKHINRFNLRRNKKSIKNKLEAANKFHYQDMKNQIEACLDAGGKNLTKAPGVSDDVFKSIKNAKNGMKAKAAGKQALIVGGITAGVTFVVHKILSMRAKNLANQNINNY